MLLLMSWISDGPIPMATNQKVDTGVMTILVQLDSSLPLLPAELPTLSVAAIFLGEYTVNTKTRGGKNKQTGKVLSAEAPVFETA